MVRALLAMGLALVLAGPVNAQAIDWSEAGGDLFGRPFATLERTDLGLEVADVPTLARLTQPFDQAVVAAAERHGLDPKLLHALVVVESGYDPMARSPVGAGGLTQLMPGTARELGVGDRFDPNENLGGGADYLARQMLRFRDLRLALAAYNAGPGRVARLGRIPNIPETQAYVASVVDCYLALTAGRGVRSARQCRTPETRP